MVLTRESVGDEDWFAAQAARYWSSVHITALPSGNLACFRHHGDGVRWQLDFIGGHEALAEYLRASPPPSLEAIRLSRPAPRPIVGDPELEALLADLF